MDFHQLSFLISIQPFALAFNIKFISHVSKGTNGCNTHFRHMRKLISSFTAICNPK